MLAAPDWAQIAAHPLIVAICAPMILACIAGTVAFSRRVLRILTALDAHVLPHFMRAPGVELGGDDDHTLPGRTLKVEQAVTSLTADVTSLDGDLRVHMAEEARQRGDDVRELRGSIGRVHDRIDAIAKERT